MKLTVKRWVLHFCLAICSFIGFGLIGVPGPHGGIAINLPYMFQNILSLPQNPSSLVFYLPFIILFLSGFFSNYYIRILFSCSSTLWIGLIYFNYIFHIYAPVIHITILTGALLILSLVAAFFLPLFFFKGEKTTNSKIVVLEIFLLLLIAVFIGFIVYSRIPKQEEQSINPQPWSYFEMSRSYCSKQLNYIGLMLKLYSVTHQNQYPTPDAWCDLLCQGYLIPNQLNCLQEVKKASTYAINPNCKPDSDPNMVLLFETGIGWNQRGGAELLTVYNHDGAGLNVLFNDKRVEWIPKEVISELKWSE